uniref:tRNA pseudouridine(55) synthase n=1 Tax=Cacopsylla melanoneura TaxID=428564 RepID=A0A8D8SF08_9HEMI
MEYFRHILDRRTFKLLNNGVFCVNKVKNTSTSNVINQIKSVLSQDISHLNPEAEDHVNMFMKVGHGGILEDSASGVLVVGVSFGCKVLNNVSNRNKHYRVTGRLGAATDTFTNSGNITSSAPYDHITQAMIESCLKFFEGRIIQSTTSPLLRFSCRPRVVECHHLCLVSFCPPYFTLDVVCGNGFYVRSLVHDLGAALESAACVTDCVRTQQGPFSLKDCLNQEDWSLENILASMMTTKFQHKQLFNVLPAREISYLYHNVHISA